MSADSLEVTVARIEAKLDLILGRGDDHEARLRGLEAVLAQGDPGKLAQRIGRLERVMWMLAGAATAAGAGGGATLSALLGQAQ